MPNPLSRVKPGASFFPDSIIHRAAYVRPMHAIKAAQVILEYSVIDNILTQMFVNMMGGPKELLAEVYINFDSQHAKSAAISTVAKNTLEQPLLNIFNRLLKVAKRSAKNRNKLAHWVWGHSDSIDDGLLLADPKKWLMKFMSYETTELADHILVYTLKDLDDLVQQAERTRLLAVKFGHIIINHPENANGELLAELQAAPELQ